MFNINQFVNEYITTRSNSMFISDIEENKDLLYEEINGKSLLVIGGAGSIGSSYIRALLPVSYTHLTLPTKA